MYQGLSLSSKFFSKFFSFCALYPKIKKLTKKTKIKLIQCPSTMVTWECTKTAQFRLDEILPAAKTNSKINMHARLKKLIDPKNPNLANICDLVVQV